MPQTTPKTPPPRIQIENVWPVVDCGRYAPKRTVGDVVEVTADIFRDGHEQLKAAVRYRAPSDRTFTEVPMTALPADRWQGGFPAVELGRYRFTIEAWVDRFASWREEVGRKVEFGQPDLAPELAEGEAILADRAPGLAGEDRELAERALEAIRGKASQKARLEAALDPLLAEALARHPKREESTRLPRALEIDVERERARFGSWFELFPRSFGGFAGVQKQLPRLAELGFDVIYLPPVHPIGTTHRKGRNNATVARPDDPGSPWAIGSADGGHTAINPDLGTMDEFEELVEAARGHNLEIAIDFAIQCSPDHPWLHERPQWFHRRPDGTLKYAENPPKKYQDIYNVNFDSEDWRALWDALLEVVLFWVERGVKIFRVDNPHTKPLAFWEWLIREVRARDPEVVFLAEAFTKPAMMRALAKAGFSQSYTYFTWRNARWELEQYLTELNEPEMSEVYRPNFFANTPDILHAYLQEGGPPAFAARLVLAATLSPSYGIYSGFERYENTPVREGSEEYLNSEKYEIRRRDLDGPLMPLIARVNAARRENPPLQRLDVRFIETENDQIIAYAKGSGPGAVIVCVNLDPHNAQEGVCTVPWGAMPGEQAFTVRDLLTDATFAWQVGRNYVRLEPALPAHLLRVLS